MLSSHGREAERPAAVSLALVSRMHQAVGNALLGAAYIAYCGGLEAGFRWTVCQHWMTVLEELDIAHSKSFDFSAAVGDPSVISEWIDCGLSNSKNAIENAIIMNMSSRWPLIIDPQEQAINWIRNHQSSHGLVQVSPESSCWSIAAPRLPPHSPSASLFHQLSGSPQLPPASSDFIRCCLSHPLCPVRHAALLLSPLLNLMHTLAFAPPLR